MTKRIMQHEMSINSELGEAKTRILVSIENCPVDKDVLKLLIEQINSDYALIIQKFKND